MTYKITRKPAHKKLAKMVKCLSECKPEEVDELFYFVAGAHYFAYMLGILNAAELNDLSTLVALIAVERNSDNEDEDEAPHDTESRGD